MPNRRDVLKQLGTAAGGALAAGAWSRPARAARPRIKIGQIGTGHAHASKLSAYRKSDDYEVVGVVEPDAELRSKAQSQELYSGLPWMTRDELLGTPGLQAVLVETRVRDLLDTAEACVAAGKHICLDKPAGESLPQFRRILEAADEQKLLVQMGYMYRYNPGFQFIFQAVRDGWLGDIFALHTVMSKTMSLESRKKLLAYRGGTMFELGCHIIDAALIVMGKPDRVVPYARHSARYNDGLLDNQLAVLEYPRATVTVRSALMEVDGFEQRQFVVSGDGGTADLRPLEPPKLRATFSRPQGAFKKGYQDIPVKDLPRYDADLADLARVIRGEKEFEFTPEHDVAVQETILLASGLPTGG